jgi:hypothetical protein
VIYLTSKRGTGSLILRVAFIGDDRDEAPITEKDQHDLSRLLLHRLTVLEAALRRVEDLRRRQPRQRNQVRREQADQGP